VSKCSTFLRLAILSEHLHGFNIAQCSERTSQAIVFKIVAQSAKYMSNRSAMHMDIWGKQRCIKCSNLLLLLVAVRVIREKNVLQLICTFPP